MVGALGVVRDVVWLHYVVDTAVWTLRHQGLHQHDLGLLLAVVDEALVQGAKAGAGAVLMSWC